MIVRTVKICAIRSGVLTIAVVQLISEYVVTARVRCALLPFQAIYYEVFTNFLPSKIGFEMLTNLFSSLVL